MTSSNRISLIKNNEYIIYIRFYPHNYAYISKTRNPLSYVRSRVIKDSWNEDHRLLSMDMGLGDPNGLLLFQNVAIICLNDLLKGFISVMGFIAIKPS